MVLCELVEYLSSEQALNVYNPAANTDTPVNHLGERDASSLLDQTKPTQYLNRVLADSARDAGQ